MPIIVLYRDHKNLGMADEKTSPKNQPDKTKPKQAFRSTQKVFKQVATKFKN